MTPRQLCEAMITVSSNLAANILIETIGVENIRGTVRAMGAAGMQVLRGVEDGKAFEKGLNITKIHHDAAIVYGPRPFVIVVLVRGIAEERTSAALIAAITREVFDSIR